MTKPTDKPAKTADKIAHPSDKLASTTDKPAKPSDKPASPENKHHALVIHLSRGAAKIVNEEEVRMLLKWSWEEIEARQKEGYNLFRFPKLGICVVRDKDELVILTDDEHRNALKDEHKK